MFSFFSSWHFLLVVYFVVFLHWYMDLNKIAFKYRIICVFYWARLSTHTHVPTPIVPCLTDIKHFRTTTTIFATYCTAVCIEHGEFLPHSVTLSFLWRKWKSNNNTQQSIRRLLIHRVVNVCVCLCLQWILMTSFELNTWDCFADESKGFIDFTFVWIGQRQKQCTSRKSMHAQPT